MLRSHKFHTDSITNYLGYLKTKLNMRYSKLCDDVEEYLMDDSLPVSGPEMAVGSVTNLNSNYGILISLIGPPLSEVIILNYTKPFLDRATATIDAPM